MLAVGFRDEAAREVESIFLHGMRALTRASIRVRVLAEDCSEASRDSVAETCTILPTRFCAPPLSLELPGWDVPGIRGCAHR